MKTTRILLSAFILAEVFSTARAADIKINSNLDTAVAADGKCTLREAIINANTDTDTTGGDCAAGSGVDRIKFTIGAGGVQTIQPTTALPAITAQITIDGSTQTGFVGSPLIEIDGTNAGTDVSGLVLSGHTGSIINSLVINRFKTGINSLGGAGITITNGGSHQILGCFLGTNTAGTTDLGNQLWGVACDHTSSNQIGNGLPTGRNLISGNNVGGVVIDAQSNNNTVRGNRIGTNAAGTSSLGNGQSGVLILGLSNNTIVGGTLVGEGNLISSNANEIIVGATTTGTLVQGNLIGTNVTGTAALGNGVGVLITGGASSTIGGASPGARNVISGNATAGISINALGANGNVVQNNFIGTDISGAAPLANGIGVRVEPNISGSPLNTTIGGTGASEGNVIAFNTQDGVQVMSGVTNPVGVKILGNSIHSNGSAAGDLGIDLNDDGVTANDAGDGDTGVNNLQNFPVLSSACVSGGNTLIKGTLNSTASTSFTVEFFTNATANLSGHGEGQILLDRATVTTDGAGNATIETTIAQAITAGQFVSSTATDPSGNTSEFSANVVAFVNTSPQIGQGAGPLTLSVDANSTCPLAANEVSLSGTDSDTAAANLTWSISTLPATGTATFTGGVSTGANVSVCYQLAANQIGSDNFTVTLSDDCGGADIIQVNVTVQDVVAPAITCPADATVVTGQPTAPAALGSATASDALDPAPTVTFVDATASGTCPALEVITRMWTATDASGNSATCQQTITVNDQDDDGDATVNCAEQLAVPSPAPASACGTCGGGAATAVSATLATLLTVRRRRR